MYVCVFILYINFVKCPRYIVCMYVWFNPETMYLEHSIQHGLHYLHVLFIKMQLFKGTKLPFVLSSNVSKYDH